MISYFDWHCDTLSKLSGYLESNELHIQKQSLRCFDKYTQVFALYTSGRLEQEQAFRCAKGQLKAFEERICGDYGFAQNSKYSAILSIENCGCLKDDIKSLDYFIQKGVKVISLTHNLTNRYACGSSESIDNGLTLLGKEIVRHAQNNGVIIDVSHLSFKSFWDVINITQRPVVATHSCSYTLCNHARNLTDDMYRAICECGGLVGLNLYPPFLGEHDVCEHIYHFCNINGHKHLAFGCDFDGVDILPDGIQSVQDIEKYVNKLKKYQFNGDIIKDIYYNNSITFLNGYIGDK